MTLIEELKNLDRTLQTKDLDTLIDKMLDNIGSVDPELRDTLIFNTFGKLILNDYLTPKQMERIIEVCLKNLYFNIGQREDDSVFMRSFSAFVIGLILRKDRQKRFLSDVITMQAIESNVEYLKLEKGVTESDIEMWVLIISEALTEIIKRRGI